ncbi:hypothetical protein GL263_16965 [Streptomyces durbertensis]|uniref:Uncharacterized protein n=1 Tax=Streptomyces durbertensis TaxID=2448886 RepID=A0ABR6EIW1_9ACTN|nr:hypothetical protein [Streptomyces durbertensis]MBB1245247.1 hypothetical protein [Streptomyces durbertensis]
MTERADVRVSWEIPATPPGFAGRVERFTGPGKRRSESVVELGGGTLCVLLLAAGVWASGAVGGWSTAQLVIVAVVALDLVGGVLTNSTNAAKRWYHRAAPGARRARLLFVSAHLAHLAAMGLVVLSGDWGWTAGNAALLAVGAVCVEFAPLHLRRPVSMVVLMAAVLVNLFWLTVPLQLAWFAPLFFLKLVVCHLVPEAPLEGARDA